MKGVLVLMHDNPVSTIQSSANDPGVLLAEGVFHKEQDDTDVIMYTFGQIHVNTTTAHISIYCDGTRIASSTLVTNKTNAAAHSSSVFIPTTKLTAGDHTIQFRMAKQGGATATAYAHNYTARGLLVLEV